MGDGNDWIESFARLLKEPTRAQEERLRIWFGDDLPEMQQLAALGPAEQSQGNVLLLGGFPGTSLDAIARDGARTWLWLNPVEVIRGHLERLRLSPDGKTPADPKWDIVATTPMALVYGLLGLTLRTRWRVFPYACDWRLGLADSADLLNTYLEDEFNGEQPVHFVAHSFGGLVVRKFIERHKTHWQALWDERGNGQRGGRFVMMGTPNHGSFVAVQGLAGIYGLDKLAAADPFHSEWQLREIVATFPGLYQAIPSGMSPPFDEVYWKLFKSSTYGNWPHDRRHLRRARKHVEHFGDAVDVRRMIYVAGTNQPTPSGIRLLGPDRFEPLDDPNSYTSTCKGDGLATYERSILRQGDAEIPMHFVEERHARLPLNRTVLDQIVQLLLTGEWSAETPAPCPEPDVPARLQEQRQLEEARLARIQRLAAELADATSAGSELEQVDERSGAADAGDLHRKRELTGLLLDV